MRSFIVTDLEAGKLPRWALLLLCALYVLPGLLGRDPWRTNDAAGFGIALTMARGGWADWLVPNVAGQPVAEQGPLPYWIDAALVWLGAGLMTEHLAVRLATAAMLFATLALLWYASFALARRPGMQPSDPFGASASSTDYARAIADSVLLVLMATFGLLARVHETTGNVAQLAWIAAFVHGGAIALDAPARGGAIAGAAIAATLLSHGLPLAAALVLVLLALPLVSHMFRLVALTLVPTALVTALALSLVWPLLLVAGDEAARAHLAAWLHAQQAAVSGPSAEALDYFARTMPWFYWPAWPVAAWAIWRWRSSSDEPAVALPLVVGVAVTAIALLSPRGFEALLLPAAVPMALLAGVGLPTLRRGIVSLIDWFAVMSFTLFCVAVWAWWFALLTGYPPRMAYRASRLAPGFEPSLVVVELVLGALATLGWLALVRWRIARQPRMIWRAMALSSGGLVLVWFLLMTLWLPVFNERNTYREVALGLREALAHAPDDCIATRGLGLAQRASFLYFAHARFAARADDQGCGWLLVQDNGPMARTVAGPEDGAPLVWQGQRRSDSSERFRLYRTSAAQGTAGP